MKKIYLFTITLLFAGNCAMQAQVEKDDNKKETEITVKDAQGKQVTIDLPEAMTQELDSLMHLYNTKNYLKPDTNCNMPDVNPVYDKAIYMKRLSMLPTVIEMPYNDVVQTFIDRYSGHLRNSVSYMLGAQNFYMPIFEEALDTYGLPLELKYLPVIESALNPCAVSRVGATGLWQFMLKTAKRYGLTVNSLVDERRDPIKSSYAAAHYLSDLYKLYGDWNLVIAAYNCGPDKINKAIHRSKQNDYWQIYPYLPDETKGYVPAFIAANYIMNYYCDHNICPMTSELPEKTDTILVNKDINFEQISHVLGINIDQIRALNPQYRHDLVNGSWRPSALRLPTLMITKFIDNEDSIYAYKPEEMASKRTEVEVNNEEPVVTKSRSYSRHKSYSRSSKYTRKKKNKRKHASKSVTIGDGDTLSEIAEKHNTTVSKLKKLNGINGSSIRAGKKIKVK
ncbi:MULTISPECIES: lytic transglycosylase domain-containing protein [Prevotella]|uniref:Lytic transglycosylase n=1 Tax=Prevotella herbatica TaxID=2801997 RepID=A0ABN6EF33_9BACT|nr:MULTISPECIES: lytic transglycosylase domain-containing protein [Prevotella]MDN5553967.1 transglycosylase SLT domain-containing protein [Prevotella sp.]BCS84475.1 lytic transglycosylase [Prevotella herbatica]